MWLLIVFRYRASVRLSKISKVEIYTPANEIPGYAPGCAPTQMKLLVNAFGQMG